MRWLFLFVLSLNLAYIAWQLSLPEPDSYAQVAQLKNVPSIVLLSELPSDEPRSTEQDEIVQQVRQAEASGVATDEAGDAEAAEPEMVTDSSEPVIQETPANTSVVAEAERAPQQATEQKQSCYTLGPFRNLDKLRSLTREIKSYVVSADFRGSEENEPTLFWVYLTPEKNRRKAIETGKRLKANKIKDFYIIREGEKNNGLSLGYFRNKDSAYGLAKKVSALGFDVMVEQVTKTYTMYWLDYQLADGANIPDTVLEKYIQSAKKDKISRLTRECNE